MTLSEIKNYLKNSETIAFQLPDGSFVPEHFHVTEVGKTTKHFIDCGGVLRKEERINFQLWNANDYNHRLHPEKLMHIIELSEKTLNLKDVEIEVEFQGNETINKYFLGYSNGNFVLQNTQTACLAEDACGITPTEKPKIKLSDLQSGYSCDPYSGCC
ncbi:DUF6428 family protein [Tenacibaculum sp. M341]|uniref:DUF6428 family protein n=1 Tax=Tenacibaculum sp. M341 TaxID=2530339 RepID=UPI00104EF91C|nr:DUF6428 family protein [Tenacibaculum sp. M341]TCI90326.1 hypothetical protein EYW44_13910 [Tenacibaculum sp. M341]